MTSIRTFYNRLGVSVRGWHLFGTLLVTLVLLPRAAAAEDLPIIVGTGTPGSCTEVALQNALVVASAPGPDIITFNCGSKPVTIVITGPTIFPDGSVVALVPPDQTTIDGGSRITLASLNWFGALVRVDVGSTATLANLTLESRFSSDRVYDFHNNVVNRGSLFLRNVTVFSDAPGTQIDNSGTLSMQNSTVTRGVWWGYPTHFTGLQNGGTATIDHSTFSKNFGAQGGAIQNGGLLNITNSVFTGNGGDYEGGAIASYSGTVTINNSEFSSNGSAWVGGAILAYGAALTVTNSTFTGNISYMGGAVAGSAVMLIKHCEFRGNVAGGGAAIQGSGYMENSIVTENDAQYGGGGIFATGPWTIVNSHITSNTAASGGGIYILEGRPLPTLVKTEVANNTPDDIFRGTSSTISTDTFSSTAVIDR
jgi:hypothetical protein